MCPGCEGSQLDLVRDSVVEAREVRKWVGRSPKKGSGILSECFEGKILDHVRVCVLETKEERKWVEKSLRIN